MRNVIACLLSLALSACAVGPGFTPPVATAPSDWAGWHSGSAELAPASASQGAPALQWWRVLNDPVLDGLQEQALRASPDLRMAALRFAQARAQRQTVTAQRGPALDASAGASRQRQSEYAAGSRILDAIAAGNRAAVAEVLSAPFPLYQAGFDASWELDMWGRIRRAVEAADADVTEAAALLSAAQLSIASELARNYFELRTVQRHIALTREDILALEDRLKLTQARADGGVTSDIDAEQQATQLAELRAQLPDLLEQETQGINRVALLLGAKPGEPIAGLADSPRQPAAAALPDLALGLPSDLAGRRPDIRAAEARLRSATASIGVAEAALYPSIRLGARFAYESYEGEKFGEWGSRSWSFGPSLDLPIFDGGRRRTVLKLRELKQQEAAIAYQQTVLKAWHEVDNALSGYAAGRARQRHLQDKESSSARAYEWARARYDGGLTDFLNVLDAQRAHLRARRDLAANEGQLLGRFVAIYKAIGGGDPR